MGSGWNVSICNRVCFSNGTLNLNSSEKCWFSVFSLLCFLETNSICYYYWWVWDNSVYLTTNSLDFQSIYIVVLTQWEFHDKQRGNVFVLWLHALSCIFSWEGSQNCFLLLVYIQDAVTWQISGLFHSKRSN